MKIIVTGGASGLGLAITRKLAFDIGNTVYFTFNRSNASAKLLELEFVNVKSFKLDFLSSESIEKFVNEMDQLEADVLINNAVTGYTEKHFHKMDPAEFERSFKSNVYPVLRITQKFIELRRKIKFGRIITILSSSIVNRPPIGWSEYTANKEYLHSMAESWAVENAAFGIISNCVSPSFMRTQLVSHTDERIIENMIHENPNKAILNEAEIAEIVLFLTNVTSQMNGANLVVNAAKDFS